MSRLQTGALSPHSRPIGMDEVVPARWPVWATTAASRLPPPTTAIRWSCRSSITGPGIPASDRGRLFQPFQRLGDAGGSGVGLGLAVARGFLDAMHGQITPDDTPGGGLTMRIRLPITNGRTDQGADR
jgi:signal transduction histidine kinase